MWCEDASVSMSIEYTCLAGNVRRIWQRTFLHAVLFNWWWCWWWINYYYYYYKFMTERRAYIEWIGFNLRCLRASVNSNATNYHTIAHTSNRNDWEKHIFQLCHYSQCQLDVHSWRVEYTIHLHMIGWVVILGAFMQLTNPSVVLFDK